MILYHGSYMEISKALDFFYRSEEYKLISKGVSDLHCMSDMYLAENLQEEYQNSLLK